MTWREQHLYGSSRLGVWRIDTVPTAVDLWKISNYANRRQYELSNHLGNVMAVIGDYVTIVNDTTRYPSIFSLNDYYVFGATKRWSGSEGYRYGFNGKENDNEVKGEGNQQDYGMRIYDPRLGKFLSIDPLTKEYPWLTPYQFASNTPVGGIDLDGAELAWGPGNFVWDLWMATKLKYKYGDPTGAKSLLSGMGEKYMVSSRQMSYHNDNVPKNVQERLDESSLNSANAKMIIGGSKLVSFNIETSLEASSMVLPVETALIKGYEGLRVFGLGAKFDKALGQSLNNLRTIGRELESEVYGFLSKGVGNEATKEVPALRAAYVKEVEGLSSIASKMRVGGSSSEEIARALHGLRRELGVKYKSLTPDNMLQQIYQRNLQLYGDKLGPTIDYLKRSGKSWDDIINSATRTGGKDLGF